MSSSSPHPTGPAWLTTYGGEMRRRICEYPWEPTPLGAMSSWPAHLRSLVNVMLAAGAPIAIVWGTQCRFLYNEAYIRIIQDKHPNALGMKCPEIFPEIWDDLEPLFAKVYGGDAVVLEDVDLPLTRGGESKPAYFSFSYNPIPGEAGTVDGFMAVVIETTARVLAEQARAQVFDTVLSAINDFAYTFDLRGKFVYINKALLDLWGLTLDQAVGKDFFELNYPEELATRLQRQIQEVITLKTAVRDETRYVSPAGVEGFYEYILSPVFASDKSVLLVAGSTRDITSRKRLELEAVAASRAKDAFIAALSHELRTPLNPVLLLASDAAQNPELSAEVRADFKSIADNVHLETRLIDDLLDISRITFNKLTLNLRAQDVHALLEKVVRSVEAEIIEKQLVLVQALTASRHVVVGDDVRLQQVFGNLLRNAIKFSPCKGTIHLRSFATPGHSAITVEFRDGGIGLTPEELAILFKPFAQGDHVAQGNRFGGLGLGLSISSKIAELHGGQVSASSEGRDKGATVSVVLPLSPEGDTPAGP